MPFDPLAPLLPVQQKRFATHELRRVPVVLTDGARHALAESSAEGRKLPQALAELFGGLSAISEVRMDVVTKSTHFRVTADDFHPITGKEARLLVIEAVHADASVPDHKWFINIADVEKTAVGGLLGFQAVSLARELVSLYPYQEQ